MVNNPYVARRIGESRPDTSTRCEALMGQSSGHNANLVIKSGKEYIRVLK